MEQCTSGIAHNSSVVQIMVRVLTTSWNLIFTKQVSNKGPAPKIYKEYLKHSKKTNNLV
jgi:hypothetical protein